MGGGGGCFHGGCIEATCTVCEWFLKLIILTDSTTPGSASTLLRILLCADVFWLFAAERSVCCELFSLASSALVARLRGAGVGRGGSECLGIAERGKRRVRMQVWKGGVLPDYPRSEARQRFQCVLSREC